MNTVTLLGLFVSIVVLCRAENNQRHARHSSTYKRGRLNQGRERQSRQWADPSYRFYPSQYEFAYADHQPPNEEIISEILYLLREIKHNLSVKNQQPSYQPIYVPYPILSYIPQNVPSIVNNIPNGPQEKISTNFVPQLPSRIDSNKIDDKDNRRPISLKPAENNTKTAEKIDDSESAIVYPKEDSPIEDNADISKGNKEITSCHAAILICCKYPGPEEQRNCFSSYKCYKTYATKGACTEKVIKRVVENFIETYSPK